jgi:hypothetical protein
VPAATPETTEFTMLRAPEGSCLSSSFGSVGAAKELESNAPSKNKKRESILANLIHNNTDRIGILLPI